MNANHVKKLTNLCENLSEAELIKMNNGLIKFFQKHPMSDDIVSEINKMHGVVGGLSNDEILDFSAKGFAGIVAIGLIGWFLYYHFKKRNKPKRFREEFDDCVHTFNRNCIDPKKSKYKYFNEYKTNGVATVRGNTEERKEHKSWAQHIGIYAQNLSSTNFKNITKFICERKATERPGWAHSPKIQSFIDEFNINSDDFDYACLSPGYKPKGVWCNEDDYFSRELSQKNKEYLTSQVKTLYKDYVLFSPASCRTMFASFNTMQNMYIKGKNTTVSRILDIKELQDTEKYFILISRLAPVDYHRVHSPLSGKITNIRNIGNEKDNTMSSYSVDPIIVSSEIDVYTYNKRCVITVELNTLDSLILGNIAYIVIVGATCVNSIKLTQGISENTVINVGDELATFHYGGSTVLTLFCPPKIKLSQAEEIAEDPLIYNINYIMHRMHTSVHMNTNTGYETYLEVGVPVLARKRIRLISCDVIEEL
jgi:phosphatidylserine decarboxylase